jgi:4-amino-4-deoxy-L-arabinose transferase-like glycosyltransferase
MSHAPRAGALLAGLLVVAGLVRIASIEAHGPWLDEFLSITSATGTSLDAVVTQPGDPFLAADVLAANTLANVKDAVIHQDRGNGILYHVLLHGWIKLFGAADASVRFPSLVAGVAIVFLVYRLASRVFDGHAAWCAAGLASFHPFLVRYSQEARPYALATALGTAATLAIVDLVGRRGAGAWWRAVLYGILVAGAVLSHYLTAAIILPHALFALHAVRRRAAAWGPLVLAALLSAGMAGGWLLGGARQGLGEIQRSSRSYRERSLVRQDSENFVLPTTARFVAAGIVQDLHVLTGNLLQRTGLRLSSLAVLLLIPAALLGGACGGRFRWSRPDVLLVCGLSLSSLGVGLALAAISGHVIALAPGYQLIATPYATIVVGAGISETLKGRHGFAGRGILAVYAAVLGISLWLVYEDAPWFRPANRSRALAGMIDAAADGHSVVRYERWVDARLCTLYLAHTALPQVVIPGNRLVVALDRPGRPTLFLPVVGDMVQ